MLEQYIDLKHSNAGEELWCSILDEAKAEYGQGIFDSWFSKLRFYKRVDKSFYIMTPTKFIREWIINNYYQFIKGRIASRDQSISILEIVVGSYQQDEMTLQNAKETPNDNDLSLKLSSILDQRMTFSSFVSDDTNRLAVEAANSLAQNFATNDSDGLFIHSNVGLGKTHLMHAICNKILLQDSYAKIAYMSAEKFMHYYTSSIKDGTIINFRDTLREFKVLLIDDIQFLCGKESTQKEFANTVNAFIESGKKIIVASERSPYALDLDKRTKSRLCGMMIAEIQHPTLSLRHKIIQVKAAEVNASIEQEALALIASNVAASIRELVAALYKVIKYAEILGRKVSITDVKSVLRDFIYVSHRTITLDGIVKSVAESYDLTPDDMLSKKRLAKIAKARQVAAFVCKQLTDASLNEIGQKLGGRDHSTVVYSIKKIEQDMMTDSKLSAIVCSIVGKLNSSL